MQKDECINERVGLAMSKHELPALFNECGSERMSHKMMLDKNMLRRKEVWGWKET